LLFISKVGYAEAVIGFFTARRLSYQQPNTEATTIAYKPVATRLYLLKEKKNILLSLVA
jgi:hypothetical protein